MRGHWHATSDLTEQDRQQVVLGCYEMLIVLAGAWLEPLPGESAQRQARRGPPRSSIGPPYCSPSRPMPSRCAGRPAWNAAATWKVQASQDRRRLAFSPMEHSTTS